MMSQNFFQEEDDAASDPPNGTPRYRFKLIPFNKIEPSAKASYLVWNLIPAQGLIVLWGPPKCGKSFWILNLIFHIALGWHYRDHRVKQGRVVYICCEGEFAIPARIEAFRQNRLIAEPDDIPFDLLPTRLRLPADLDELILDLRGQLGNERPAIIVIDTLNRSIEGSESSDEDMGDYIKALDKLRETFKCAVVVVHHCGIDASRPRGHTALRGACDAEISVRRDAEGRVITTVEFMKDGPANCITMNTLVPVTIGINEDGDPVTSCIIEPVEGVAPEPKLRKSSLSAQNKRAFELLGEAINKDGTVPPACDHIPSDTPCVPERLWRDYCYAGQVANSDKPDPKRKAFSRKRSLIPTLRRTAAMV